MSLELLKLGVVQLDAWNLQLIFNSVFNQSIPKTQIFRIKISLVALLLSLVKCRGQSDQQPFLKIHFSRFNLQDKPSQLIKSEAFNKMQYKDQTKLKLAKIVVVIQN